MNLRSKFNSFLFSLSVLPVLQFFGRTFIPGLFLLLCLSACSATRSQYSSTSPYSEELIYPPLTEEQDSLAQVLRLEATSWAGTPHILGGTSRSGIDCSALVQNVFQDVLSTAVPRTTELQSKVGNPVDMHEVRVGDLIFYKISARSRHVGIYVGNGEFFHASKSEGVTISKLSEPYWQRRFWQIRRVLDDGVVGIIQNPDKKPAKGQVRW